MKLNPAAKVAAGATAVIAVAYVIGVIVFNVAFASHQTTQSDDYLGTRLSAAAGNPRAVRLAVPRGPKRSDQARGV